MRSLLLLSSLLYTAAAQSCSETLSGSSGILRSPGYPEPYPPNVDCYWDILSGEEGSCVLFTVEDFVVPSENEDICPGDHFVLESCGSWDSIAPERYYCGDYTDAIAKRGSFNLVQHYQTNATSLRVSFHSDSVNQGKGFLMQYQVLPYEECRQWGSPGFSAVKGRDGEKFDCVVVMDDVDGSFKTPGYPAPYDPDIACAYGLQKPSAEYCGVILRLSKFDLEARDGSTCSDYFGMPGCRKLCGTYSEPGFLFYEYQPGATRMFLQFVSDFSVQGRGFKITYAQVTDCFNPYQPECPNDELNRFAKPTECTPKDKHDCLHNGDCSGTKICCFDGCYRSCKDPVESVRRRREVDRNLPDLGWVGNFSTLFPSSPVHVPVPHIPTYSVRPPPTQ